MAKDVPVVIGETGDQALVGRVIGEHEVSAIIHFAASIVVPDSVADPLGYYRNNTVNSRALIESAIKAGWGSLSFRRLPRSTAILRVPVGEDVAPRRPRPTDPPSS